MIPVVASLDGKEVVKLSVAKREGGMITGSNWIPVSSEKVPTDNFGGVRFWGNVQRSAAEWSADGKYLWMTKETQGIYVAKRENNKWWLKSVGVTLLGDFGLQFRSFNGSQVAWTQNIGDVRQIYELGIADIETNITKSVRLRAALEVRSMDW